MTTHSTAADDYAPLADLVRARERMRLTARGGGTLLDLSKEMHTVRTRIAEVRPFNRLLAHAADDMTVTVQAGMTFAELDAILATRNQHLPLDVPDPTRTTIGGAIAANLSGSRRLSRGTIRDLLIGITVIGAGGELIRGGGRVVKNVAGYDLCKLYTGSWGWLGVIVEATFRVFVRPAASAGLWITLESPAALEPLAAKLLAGPLRPASLDLSLRSAQPPRVLVAFEGSPETVAWQLDECRRSIPGPAEPCDAAGVASFRQAAADLWLAEGVFVKFGVPGDRAAALVADLCSVDSQVEVAAQLGSGIVTASIQSPAALRSTTERAAALGGHWLTPRIAAAAHANIPPLGPPRPDWALMQRVKSALDPRGIFESPILDRLAR